MILGYIVKTASGSAIELDSVRVDSRLESVLSAGLVVSDPSLSLFDIIPAEARVGVFAINQDDDSGAYSISPVAIHAQVAQVMFFIGE